MSNVVIDQTALLGILTGTSGPIAVDLTHRLIRCVTAAKINASGRPGPKVKTGRLRSSITYELGADSRGLFGDYGTNVDYGRYLELGLLRNGAKYPFLLPALPAAAG